MRNVSLRAALAAAAIAAATPAAATNGMRMIGFGPIQNSMGGASAAAPLDSVTIVSNPAGLTALGRRLDLAGTAFAPAPEYTADGAASGATMESDRPIDFIPTIGAAYPFNEQLTFGFLVLGTAGMGVEYGADLFGSPALTSYMNGRLAPAVAYEVADGFSLGAALNLMGAQLEYNLATGANSLNLAPREAAFAFGVGATVGLSYQAPEGVTLGVAYETRSWFQDFEYDIPAHTLNTPQGPAPVPGGKETFALDQPDIVTIGAGFNPAKPLLVAVDVQWIRWSTVLGNDQPEITSDPTLTGAPAFDASWSDQLVFKIGAQYELDERIKLRAGYNWADDPLDASRALENIMFPAVSRHHFTVGGGYQTGTLSFNASILYSPTAEISGANEAQGIAFYETRMSQLSFDVGAAWKF